MQLTKPIVHAGKISQALAGATCALLNIHEVSAGTPGSWKFDTAILYYGEDNSRVSAIEPVISATRYFEDDQQLSAKIVVDSLTGASPSGATPSTKAQTFTRPSGNGTYTIEPGEAPIDDTFKDTRTAFNLNWSSPLSSNWHYSTGLNVSSEHDYQSMGVNGGLTRYLNDKNTELNMGLSFAADQIKPEGGIPHALGRVALKSQPNFTQAFADSRPDDSDSKSLTDLLLGVTQVINRRTIMQFNYSLSASSGYMTDPYKLLSLIDRTTGETAEDNSGFNVYLYEQRPDSRNKHAFYWQTKYMLDVGDVIDSSYRFMTDDWGITSHTLDFKYRWQLTHAYWEPHIRFYKQSEADFYHRYLVNTADQYDNVAQRALVENASADYRLGDLTDITLGLKYAHKLGSKEISGRLEYFIQSNSGENGFGALANEELYPNTKAVMFTLGYSF